MRTNFRSTQHPFQSWSHFNWLILDTFWPTTPTLSTLVSLISFIHHFFKVIFPSHPHTLLICSNISMYLFRSPNILISLSPIGINPFLFQPLIRLAIAFTTSIFALHQISLYYFLHLSCYPISLLNFSYLYSPEPHSTTKCPYFPSSVQMTRQAPSDLSL